MDAGAGVSCQEPEPHYDREVRLISSLEKGCKKEPASECRISRSTIETLNGKSNQAGLSRYKNLAARVSRGQNWPAVGTLHSRTSCMTREIHPLIPACSKTRPPAELSEWGSF